MRSVPASLGCLILTILIVAVTIPAAAEWQNYPADDLIGEVAASAECLRVDQAPTLDAAADEPMWQQVRPIHAWINPQDHHDHTAEVPMEVRLLHDGDNIYVFFETAPPPAGLELPAPSGWRVNLTIDPRPDHIDTPHVSLKADGSGSISISSWKSNYRAKDYEALPKPQGQAEVADGCLRGEFAIPFAGLAADPPALGDVWDLDVELYIKSRTHSSRWGTDFIPGRLYFVSAATPAPAYYLTDPQVPVTPHHGKFIAHVTVSKQGEGPMPTQLVAEGLTGKQRGAATTYRLVSEQIGKPLACAIEMSEPGMGALRFRLLNGETVADTLVVPVEIDPQLDRFADMPAGSFDCFVRTLTIGPGDRLEGQFGFAPTDPQGRAQVHCRLEPVEIIGSYATALPMKSVTLGADKPLLEPFSMDLDERLPCGTYRLAGTVEAGGDTQNFQSQPFNVAGVFVAEYDQMMAGWQQRLSKLDDRQLKYPFQRDCAELLLYMLGRHGAEALEKASTYTRERRPWWPINWAVQLEGMLDALEQNRDYFAGRSGIFLCAYRSKVDGTLQPYELTVPDGFDKSQKWPTLFAIHGTSSHYYYSLIALIELGYKPITQWPMLCVGLDGRAGPTQHGWLADVDLLEVYDQLQQHFGLDPQRVHITGYSRGGRAAWYYAIHLPHLFAGAAPCAPFGYMHAGELPNVRHMLVNSYHGVHDPRTANANGPVMIGALNDLGGNGYHMQIRVAGHDLRAGYRDRRFMQSLLDAEAPQYPKDIEFVCTRPRYSRAYWMTLDRLIDYGSPAVVKLRVAGLRTIRIDTENVGALSLDLSGGQVQKGQPVRIVLNDDEREMEYADNLRLEIEPAEADVLKTPELAGPLGDWMFEKSLIVYGTQAGAEIAAAGKELADQISIGVPRKKWFYIHDTEANWPIKADTEVTADDIRDCNLILLGGPGANRITTRLAAKLPVHFAPDGLTVGDISVTGAEASAAFIYPNPENPQHYVVVVGAADPGQKPKTGAGTLRSLSADLVLAGGETATGLPGALHFDAQWQLQPPQVVCQVPAGNQTDWNTLLLEATHVQTAADIAYRYPYGSSRPLPEGPLYYADVASPVRQQALLAFEMTGAEFEAYLQSWITLFGKPPLLQGVELDWSTDPVNKVVRINSTGLEPDRKYKIVADEVTITRATWSVPQHVGYHLLPDSAAEAALKHIEQGNWPR